MTALQSIKISAAVAANRSTAGTIYTAPAASYAILNLYTPSVAGNLQVNVGGERVFDTATEAGIGVFRQIMVGPGQQVDIVQNSGGQTVYVSGVLLANTSG